MGKRNHLLAVIALSALVVTAAPARGGPDAAELLRAEQLQSTLAAVAEDVRPCVVAVRAFRRFDSPPAAREGAALPGNGAGAPLAPMIPSVGSGIIIGSDGLILTSEHVVHGVEPDAVECILSSSERYTVAGMTTDPRSDLAVLSIDAHDLRAAKWGDLDELRQGHFVIVLGNPLGTAFDGGGQPAMSFGIVSALGQDLTQKLGSERYYGDLIQTDARINPGNSGGPLVNLRGEVVGITTAVSTRSGGSDGVGYAIPMNTMTRWVVQQLTRGEEVEYGYIGVRLEERRSRQPGGQSNTEVLVVAVEPGTPAETAGMLRGDVLREFNSQKVESERQFVGLVAMAGVGSETPVSVLRDGKEIELKVVPRVRPNGERGVNIEPALDWRDITFSVISREMKSRFGLPESASGTIITSVTGGTAADKAGFRTGQVIRRVNGEPARGLRHIRKLLQAARGQVTVTIDGQPPREITMP